MALRRPCLTCGKLITRGSYCSKCDRLRGRRWVELREQVKSLYRYRCAMCQREDVPLELHHRDSDFTNNTPPNLVPLCRPCHRKITIGPP